MTRRIEQIDLRLLRVFTTLVDHGSFIAAQVDLNINQSTLSSHIKELEERLGMRLCERGRRTGFRLTDDGKLVYEATQRLFRHLDEFNSEVKSYAGQLIGELEIVSTDHIILNENAHISETIENFKSRSGRVNINFHVKAPTEVVQGVADGLFHVGIGSRLEQMPGVDYTPLFTQTHLFYCGSKHPLFHKSEDELNVGQLMQMEMIRPKFGQASAVPKSMKRLPTMTATCFNIEAIAMFVLSGQYLGYLPENYARLWVERKEMKVLLPEELNFEVEFGLMVQKKRIYKPLVQAFIDDLLEAHQVETHF